MGGFITLLLILPVLLFTPDGKSTGLSVSTAARMEFGSRSDDQTTSALRQHSLVSTGSNAL